jgi:hypothetical protein
MRWGGIARFLFATGLTMSLCHSAAMAAGRFRVAQTSTVNGVQLAGRVLPNYVPHPRHGADGRRHHRKQCQSKHGLSAQLHDPTDQLPGALRTHFAVALSAVQSN